MIIALFVQATPEHGFENVGKKNNVIIISPPTYISTLVYLLHKATLEHTVPQGPGPDAHRSNPPQVPAPK